MANDTGSGKWKNYNRGVKEGYVKPHGWGGKGGKKKKLEQAATKRRSENIAQMKKIAAGKSDVPF